MAQVVVTIAGRTYRMNCEDGQEQHLENLARGVDAKMSELKLSFGEIGEQRLVVMAALTIADDLDTARNKALAAEDENLQMQTALAQSQSASAAEIARLEAALDRASERIELIVGELNTAKS